MILSMVLKSGIRLNRKKSKNFEKWSVQNRTWCKSNQRAQANTKRKDNIRMCLFNLKKKVIEKESVMDVLTMYFKIRGLINTLKQQGDKKSCRVYKAS